MSDNIRTSFWETMAESPILMVKLNSDDSHAEPLIAQLDPAANGEFWFYTSRNNRIAPGGPAIALYVSRNHDLFCSISGTLTEEKDSAVIDRYWSPRVNSWYPKGRTDPDMLMMRFDLENAEIWKPDNSLQGLFRLMSGKTETPREMGLHQTIPLTGK
ncbi:MAG: general stress protein [Sphingobium sp.]|nr:general stress protein [Sphingobium sp.]